MTSPEAASTSNRADVAFETALAKMGDKELMLESQRLVREGHKLGVQTSAFLLAAIQERFAGPIDQAVEELAKSMQLKSDQLWLHLRTDHGTRVPLGSSDASTLIAVSELILVTCGRSGEEVNHVRTLVRKMQEIWTQRDRIMAARQRLRGKTSDPVREKTGDPGRPSRSRTVQAVVPPVVPDAPGWDHKPDPLTATSVTEYVDLLGQLHVWAGEPSLRQLARLARHSGGGIAHSTFSAMLNNHHGLPTQRTVVLFVRALGCDDCDVERWVTAWRTLRFQRRASAKPSGLGLRIAGG